MKSRNLNYSRFQIDRQAGVIRASTAPLQDKTSGRQAREELLGFSVSGEGGAFSVELALSRRLQAHIIPT